MYLPDNRMEFDMQGSVHSNVKHSLKAAASLYYQLVLVVGGPSSGKTHVLRDVADQFGTSVVNVNLALSNELLELTTKQRILQLPSVLDRVVEQAAVPVILDNLEILFSKDLGQDPLRLLQRLSRNRAMVAAWSGTYAGERLSYAGVGHPEYRSYDSPDALIVGMNSEITVDLTKNWCTGQQ